MTRANLLHIFLFALRAKQAIRMAKNMSKIFSVFSRSESRLGWSRINWCVNSSEVIGCPVIKEENQNKTIPIFEIFIFLLSSWSFANVGCGSV